MWHKVPLAQLPEGHQIPPLAMETLLGYSWSGSGDFTQPLVLPLCYTFCYPSESWLGFPWIQSLCKTGFRGSLETLGTWWINICTWHCLVGGFYQLIYGSLLVKSVNRGKRQREGTSFSSLRLGPLMLQRLKFILNVKSFFGPVWIHTPAPKYSQQWRVHVGSILPFHVQWVVAGVDSAMVTCSDCPLP